MGYFDDGPVHLDSPETLFAVLRELAGDDALDWRGFIDVWGEQNPPGPAKWRIQLTDNSGKTETAMVGQYMVLTYGRLLVLDEVQHGG